jgi:hypothetical protein
LPSEALFEASSSRGTETIVQSSTPGQCNFRCEEEAERLNLNRAQVAADAATEQQRREEAEWAAVKKITEEQEEDERRQTELRRQRDAKVRAAAAEAVDSPEAPMKAEAGKSLASEITVPGESSCIDGSPASFGVVTNAVLPARMDATALASMSKKELVLILHSIASTKALHAAQLSGNPANVARKASKEKASRVIRYSACEHAMTCCDMRPCSPSDTGD